MSERINNFINTTTARIITDADVGTGFFIYPGHLLTCAHVVTTIHKKEGKKEVKIEQLTIHYDGMELSGSVLAHSVRDYPDLAVIKVHPVPVHPCLRIANKSNLIFGKNYLAKGYQLLGEEEVTQGRFRTVYKKDTLTLKYEGLADEESQPFLKFEEARVRGGISGAPVVDIETGQVVGIMKKTIDADLDSGGMAVPVDQIRQFLGSQEVGLLSKINANNFQKRLSNWEKIYLPVYENLVKNRMRIALFSAIIFALVLWVVRHYGFDYTNLFIASIPIAFHFILNTLKNSSAAYAKEIDSIYQSISKLLLSTYMMFFLGLVVLFIWSFRSSVIIESGEGDENVVFSVTDSDNQEERTRKLSGSEKTRFGVWTFPWGKEYLLQPADFVSKVKRIYPWGIDMDFPYDFDKEPILYIRHHCLDVRNPVMNEGRLVITAGSGNDEKILYEHHTLVKIGALMIGKGNFDFATYNKTNWRDDINSYYPFPEMIMDRCIENWEILDTINISLIPRSHGEVRFYKKGEKENYKTIASYDFQKIHIQDILMIPHK